MRTVVGILLMVTGATSGWLFQDPVVCRFNESNQCYVAVGQRLHLLMPPVEKFNLKITNKTFYTRTITSNRLQSHQQTHNLTRWQFDTDNKMLIITGAETSDSGNYSLEIFTSDGTTKGTFTVQVNIEAPVSSVKISQQCLLSGMTVTCSANGDDRRFSWRDFNDQPVNMSDTINLDRNYQGNVTCLVENHVSKENGSAQLHPCQESTTQTAMTSAGRPKRNPGTNFTVSHKETNSCNPTLTPSHPSSVNKWWFLNLGLTIMGSVAVLLVVISAVAFYVYKRTHRPKNQEATSHEGRELVYAQVAHFGNGNAEQPPRKPRAQVEDVEYAVMVPRASKKKRRMNDDDVQYGELVFNTPARNHHHHRQTPGGQDDCIYSQVHHGS